MSENTAADTSADGASSPSLPPTNRDLAPQGGGKKPAAGLRTGGSGLARNLGLVIALLLLAVAGFVTTGDRFLSAANLTTILSLAAATGIISIGMTFVITGGGIDLSVGSVMGLATVWATTLATRWPTTRTGSSSRSPQSSSEPRRGWSTASSSPTGGSWRSTLAMLVAARGLAEIISNRQTQLLDVRGFEDFFGGSFLGLRVTV